MPIDCHAHYVPPQLLNAIAAKGREIGVALTPPGPSGTPALHFDYGFKARPFFPRLVEPVAQRLAWMDEQRIDLQIIGTWPDIFGYGLGRDACVAWHRMLNDTLADWCAGRSRFAWIGSVPLIDAEAAAAELDRIAGTGAVGVIISANIENTNIGELPLDPFWAKAEELALPVLIHPVLVGPAPRAAKFGLAQIAQYTFDTTMGVGSLLMTGVLDRFPRLKLVLSHGGGAYPYLAGRFDIMHRNMDRAAQSDVAAEMPSAYAPRMIYDSIVHAPKALRFLIDVVGLENIVLGTDYSFPPADMEPLDLIRAAGLTAAQSEAIAEGNPRRVFTRLR